MRRFLIAALVLAIAARASATYCELTDEPVCGVDGIEYTNACIAKIQGVEIDYPGECGSEELSGGESSNAPSGPTDPGVYIDRSFRQTEGRVEFKTILKYKAAEYRFVGRYDREEGDIPSQKFVCTPQDEPRNLDIGAPYSLRRLLQRDPLGGNDRPRGVGLDRRGNHYVQPAFRNVRSPPSASRPAFPPAVFRRSLLSESHDSDHVGIIGENNIKEVEVKDGKVKFPASPIIKIAIEFDGKRTVCSGALIGKNQVLTSAHCLYNDETDYYYNFDYFKFYKSNLEKLDAYVDFAIVPTQYVLGLKEYDVGLITLVDKEGKDLDLSATLGFLGYGDSCTISPDGSDVKLYGFNTEDHNKLSTSKCKLHPTCQTILTKEKCDVTEGMIGGPLVDGRHIIRAVAQGSCGDEYNQATALAKPVVSFITEAVDSVFSL